MDSMANKNKSVFGIYSSRSAVDNAVSALKSTGFQHSDVSVLLPENLGSKEIATEKNTQAPEGATTGAGSGAVIGGTLGWLVGIGALAIPGLGPFIAAGPNGRNGSAKSTPTFRWKVVQYRTVLPNVAVRLSEPWLSIKG
jgi:hypothetical protein